MFDNKIYYHGTTRKAIIAFGAMFNKIQIQRKDGNNNVVQRLRVPLSYSPKNKMLTIIQQLPNPDNVQIQTVVPRLSFEIIAFEYDGARKTNSMNQTSTPVGQSSAKRVYGPVPYNLTVNLYAYAKNQEDGLQIFEQIVPAFNPDFNVTVNYIPEMGIKHDLPIILNSVSFQDDYEGNLEQQRMIIWTYTFTMKLYYYGPVENQSIIRNSIVSVFNNTDLDQLTAKYTVSTDPATATPSDTFDFTFDVDETNY